MSCIRTSQIYFVSYFLSHCKNKCPSSETTFGVSDTKMTSGAFHMVSL